MNKKLVILGISAVLMLVTITFASAINSDQTNVEKKESPLYKIRTKLAIGKKITDIFENIKTKFLGDRIFFLPTPLLTLMKKNLDTATKISDPISCCPFTSCGPPMGPKICGPKN